MVFKTVIAADELAEDPTALNSNLLPVKANGEVLFLSVLSNKICGIFGIPNHIALFVSAFLLILEVSISFKTSSN